MSAAKKYHFEVEEFLEPIFQDFINDRLEDIEECEKAIAQSDFDKCKALGHKLAGNAGSYGLPTLGVLGKDLEHFGVNMDMEGIKKTHEEIKEFIKNLTVDFI